MFTPERVVQFPVDELRPHPELEPSAMETERFCQSLGCPIRDLIPWIDDPRVRVLPDGTVIGNWHALQRVRAEDSAATEAVVSYMLDAEDPALVAMHAIVGSPEAHGCPPLTAGLCFRRWLAYEREHVPVRLGRREAEDYKRERLSGDRNGSGWKPRCRDRCHGSQATLR